MKLFLGLLVVCSFLAPVALGADNEPEIQVLGASDELKSNMLAHLQLNGETCASPLGRLQRQVPAIRKSLIQALNALGYYHSSLNVAFSSTEDCWLLTINVVPGLPLILRKVELGVIGDLGAERLFKPQIDASPLMPGAVLHHGEYERLKDGLTSTAADNGFFDARFSESMISLDLVNKEADIALNFDPGEQYRFGVIEINRPGILSVELIETLLLIKEGEPYSASEISNARKSLEQSQYFNQISLSPLLGSATNKAIPLRLDLGLRPRHRWTTGLGFTTDTGPRARLEFENRYINSKGHRFDADSSISNIRFQINGSYSIPLHKSFARDVVLTSGYIVENNDTFKSKRLQTGISLPSENKYGWQQNLTLDYLRDDYELASTNDVSSLIIPGISLSKSRADNVITPNHGWKLMGSLKGATTGFLSDASFLQLYTSAKFIQGWGPLRFIGRGEVGATLIDEAGELPVSLRYFAGGDQSVRGYSFRSLGPIDINTSEVLGGKQLLVGSAELDYLIKPNWRVAVFTDVGNAFNTKNIYKLNKSVGVGIRWLSPIGPVRFDVAHPLDSDESFRIHITMGPDL